MEIHRLALSLLLLPVVACGTPVRRVPLDESRPVTITVATDAPTTCCFPGAIAGLEVANLAERIEDRPPVLLSHRAGTAYFSVRALAAEARAAANVLWDGKVYVLDFVAGPDPDRSVEFVTGEPVRRVDPGLVLRVGPAALVGRAKVWALLRAQQPELARTIGHASPGTVSEYRDFRVVVEEVWRFEVEDALVFRMRLESRSGEARRFDWRAAAVRVGRVIQPVVVTDGPAEVGPGGRTEVWAVMTGEGPAAGISVENEFRVILPRAS